MIENEEKMTNDTNHNGTRDKLSLGMKACLFTFTGYFFLSYFGMKYDTAVNEIQYYDRIVANNAVQNEFQYHVRLVVNTSIRNEFQYYDRFVTSNNTDYCRRNIDFSVESITKNKVLMYSEEIYNMRRFAWTSPIVVSKYKLLFVQIEKSASTQWKKVLQLIQNISRPENYSVHDPTLNGLRYLKDLDYVKIKQIFTDPSWTIATMVREPRARILSAYLNNLNGLIPNQGNRTVTFPEFLDFIASHTNEHWSSQIRLPLWSYRHMMIGRAEDMYYFGEALLRRIGAWNQWGHKWGKFGNETIFADTSRSSRHEKTFRRLRKYYTRDLERKVFNMFEKEYDLFNYSCTYISKQ